MLPQRKKDTLVFPQGRILISQNIDKLLFDSFRKVICLSEHDICIEPTCLFGWHGHLPAIKLHSVSACVWNSLSELSILPCTNSSPIWICLLEPFFLLLLIVTMVCFCFICILLSSIYKFNANARIQLKHPRQKSCTVWAKQIQNMKVRFSANRQGWHQ